MTGYKSVEISSAGSRLEVSRCRMQLKPQRPHDAQKHFLLRLVARQFPGFPDVAFLRGFFTTGKQQHVAATVLNEVHPVAWSVVDFQLRDTFSHGLDGTEITELQAPDSNRHLDTRRLIL